MKNKLVKLKGGFICRILDTVIQNGNSLYLVLNITNKSIIMINPKDILYLVRLEDSEYVSDMEEIIKYGI